MYSYQRYNKCFRLTFPRLMPREGPDKVELMGSTAQSTDKLQASVQLCGYSLCRSESPGIFFGTGNTASAIPRAIALGHDRMRQLVARRTYGQMPLSPIRARGLGMSKAGSLGGSWTFWAYYASLVRYRRLS